MRNINHKTVSVTRFKHSISKCSYFRQGYEDALKNRPFDYSIAEKGYASRYERGRAFAIYCKLHKQPRAQWRKNILAKTAQERVIHAYMLGYMI